MCHPPLIFFTTCLNKAYFSGVNIPCSDANPASDPEAKVNNSIKCVAVNDVHDTSGK